MDSLVSVIVPVYNVEAYLDKCVESIVSQSYQKLEIILVDDGSSDSCPIMCDAWVEKDARIRVIHKKNAGSGYARNSGLDCALGEYVTFVDSDDYLSSDAIELLLTQIEIDQSDMVVAKKVKVYADGSTKTQSCYNWAGNIVATKDEVMHMLGASGITFPASACAKLYRKHLFDQVRFFDLKTAEDTCIAAFIIDQCNSVSFIDSVVYFYFQRDTSIVHNLTQERQLDNLKSVSIVARFLLDRGYIDEARHFYLAALCKVVDLKHEKKARHIITATFTDKERKLLRSKSRRSMLSLIAHSFPHMYNWYLSRIKR